MTMPHNAGRYVMHDVSPEQMQTAGDLTHPLDYLAHEFPAPPPFTGKE
jgi:hypothetical protein